MKFSAVSLLAFSTVALASSSDKKKRNLKGGKKGSKVSHYNADYQDHYLVSLPCLISMSIG